MAFSEEIRITGKDLASPELAKASRSTKKLGNETQKAGNKMKASFTKSRAALVGYVGAFVGLSAAISFLKAATAAGLENEQENIALKNQVELTGASWDRYGISINAVIQAQANYAVITRTETSTVLRRLILITGNVQTAQDNLALTLDLATAANLDMVAAAQLVGRALEGDIEALGRYFPAIKQLTKELGANATAQEKASRGMDILREKTNGAAAAIDENVKKIREAGVAWSEFQDAAGGIILELLAPLAGGLEDVTRKMESNLIEIRKSENAWAAWGKQFAENNIFLGTGIFLWEKWAGLLSRGLPKPPSVGPLLDPGKFLPGGVDALPEFLRKQREAALPPPETQEVIPEGLRGPIDIGQELEGELILIEAQVKFNEEELIREQEHQERLGEAIAGSAQLRFDVEEAARLRRQHGRDQEMQGERILAEAQAQFAIDAMKQKEAARKRDFQSAINISNALFIFTGQKSKALFKITKALNLAEATVSGISAVQKAFSSAPFPANLPAIAFTVGATALNISKIKATQFGAGGSTGVGGVGGGGTPLIGATASGADLAGRLDVTQQPPSKIINVFIEGNLIDMADLSRVLTEADIELELDTI